MLEQLKEMLKTLVEDEEFFTIIATAMMKLKKALIEAGFSEDQAMQIIITHGLMIKNK